MINSKVVLAMTDKPREWWIQKPSAHNVPYRTNGAVFQTFRPTIIDQLNGEWIKVISADDLQMKIGMGLTRYTEVLTQRNAALAERDAYKKAKEENDERFMRERDEALEKLSNESMHYSECITRAEVERLNKHIAMITDAPFVIESITIDQRFKFEQEISSLKVMAESYRAILLNFVNMWEAPNGIEALIEVYREAKVALPEGK